MDYIVEFDYDADETDELSLRKGDIITNVRFHEEGWMLGVLKGKEGVFPSNFGRQMKEERSNSKDETNMMEDDNEDNDLKEVHVKEEVKSVNKVRGIGFGNIFAGEKIQLSQPSVTDMVVKPRDNVGQKSDKKHVSQLLGKDIVKVLYAYKAENADELNLEEGEMITVLERNTGDDGWWRGKNSSGQIGVFPDNFVENIKSEETAKPVRPVNKVNPPPPPVTAKPAVTIPKPTPAATPVRPQPIDVKSQSKLIPKASFVEKDDSTSFDTIPSHKPLNNLTADLPKRPGKRLPTKLQLNNEDNRSSVEDPPSKPSSAVKQKLEGHVVENIEASPKSKVELKKSQTLDMRFHTSRDDEVSPKQEDNKELLEKISSLETKVTLLETQKAQTSKELTELRKSSSDQIAHLSNRITTLTRELDQERMKRAAIEVDVSRIKTTVEELEHSFLHGQRQ